MLYVITAVHNRYETTRKFVNCLKRQTKKDIRLILVDDGSTDGTAQMVSKELPDAIVLMGDGSLWWGGALHKAFKYLIKQQPKDCDAVVFMNDDAEIEEDFLKNGFHHLQEHQNDLITGCGFSTNDGSLKDGPVFYDVKTGTANRLVCGEAGNCASTRSLMLSYSSLRQIGGFHPVLLPHYGSDYEYTIRACRKGRNVLSFWDFTYRFNENATGYNSLKGITARQVFSKKSRFNPIYRIILMFMVTPVQYIPRNILNGLRRVAAEKRDENDG